MVPPSRLPNQDRSLRPSPVWLGFGNTSVFYQAILMTGARRLTGFCSRDQGDQTREQIHSGMSGLCKKAKGRGKQADKKLSGNHGQIGDGLQASGSLLAVHSETSPHLCRSCQRSSAAPHIRTRFHLAPCPLKISTWEGGTPSASAKSWRQRWFASPFSGGAVTRTRRNSPRNPITSLRLARG